MSYEDDELERMRSRREQRKSESSDLFRSSYSGPKERSKGNGSGRKGNGQRSGGYKRRRPDKKKRIAIIAAEVLLLLVLVIGGAAWYIYDKTFGSFAKVEFNEAEVVNTELNEEHLENMKGYMTVACFGVDSRVVDGKMNVGKGTNADVNMICSINLETGEIRLVSIFRDTYMNINDKNTYNKINFAYAQGGPEQAVKAINKNLGLNITQYATFNWKAVAQAINILGGVDINLSENEFSWMNAFITETVQETGIGSYPLKQAGAVHLDGVQAVAYGRLRLGDTDFARTERQRIILSQAFEKAKQADLDTLMSVIGAVMPQIATNVTLEDLMPLVWNISRFHLGETTGFPAARGTADVNNIGDCVIPQTLEYNVTELHKFLFGIEDYEAPSNVKTYSQHISAVTGMYNEGKLVQHVPVDQSAHARVYQRWRANRAAERATQQGTVDETEDFFSLEESTDESESGTDESSTDESGTGSSEYDPEEDWINDQWGDDWTGGPGTGGPGTSPSQSGAAVPGRPGSTTEADGGNRLGGTGPGPSGSNPSSSTQSTEGTSGRPNNSGQSPSGTSPAPTAAQPGTAAPGGTVSPGPNQISGGNSSPGGGNAPGSTPTQSGVVAPGGPGT